MPTFRFPVLPPGVNRSYRVGRGRFYKSAEATAWARGAALIVGGWTPPERTPLAVTIRLEVKRLWVVDVDSSVKTLLDVVVGSRRDQWVRSLTIEKVKGDDVATVTVEAA